MAAIASDRSSGGQTVTAQTDEVVDGILSIVATYGNLSIEMSSLSDDEDLFHAGMTSYASVTVMLQLERRFGIEFPYEMLDRSTFESLSSIRSAVCELIGS